MKVLLVFAALVAITVANTCGPLQRLKVKRQWAESYGHGNERLEFGIFVWQHTFHHSREARSLFSKVRGDNIHSNVFKAHAQRVLSSLDLCIALLDDEDTLKAALSHLAEQHKERNVTPTYWNAFTHSVLRAIENKVGDLIFDEDSWKPCINEIAMGIQGQ
uniref:Extracellular globin n=2 Tax=Osedax mucofloris TaxID=326170 RepID=A0A0S2MLL8_OSEMU|nr:hemoglobin subunit A2 [Osedax mucofloris]